MAKNLVIFTKNNARVLTKPEEFNELMTYPNVVPDPDLSLVKGIPPHHWKLEDGLIVPMTGPEKDARNADIEAHGVDNMIAWIGAYPEKKETPEIQEIIHVEPTPVFAFSWVYAIVALFVLGAILHAYLK